MAESKEGKSSGVKPGRGFRSAEEALDQLVDGGELPRLASLLQGDGALRSELLQLVRQFVPVRAHRESVRVVAKIVRKVGEALVEDPVIIRNISLSGAQLLISTQVGLGAHELGQMTLRLRPPGGPDYQVQAKLARIVSVEEPYLTVGVRFGPLPDELTQAIFDLEHVHGERLPSPARQRLSERATAWGERSKFPEDKQHPEPTARPGQLAPVKQPSGGVG